MDIRKRSSGEKPGRWTSSQMSVLTHTLSVPEALVSEACFAHLLAKGASRSSKFATISFCPRHNFPQASTKHESELKTSPKLSKFPSRSAARKLSTAC